MVLRRPTAARGRHPDRGPPEGLTLGRSTVANLQVASNGVARLHARLSWSDDGVLIVEDLGSTNGTKVNGARVSRHPLRAGDTLTLAERFDFEVVDATESPAKPSA
jgi:ABC transport system ATP-binding/permease protein